MPKVFSDLSRHCSERAVYDDPSLHVRLLHSITLAKHLSAGEGPVTQESRVAPVVNI